MGTLFTSPPIILGYLSEWTVLLVGSGARGGICLDI